MQAMAVPLHVYDVGLEVLSPVAIGAGETEKLSAYTDYLYDGKNVRILDQKKLMQRINEHPELIEEYVRGVRGGMDNNRSTFDLKRYINDTLKCHVDDVTASIVESHVDPGRQEINRCISSNGKAYIPGSSLKGALRTAVMVDWMVSHSASEKTWGELKQAVHESDFKDARRALKRINVGRACLGPISNDQFKYFHVSDLCAGDDAAVIVTSRKRFSLKRESKDIPIPCEAIKPGSRFGGEIRVYGRRRESAEMDSQKVRHQDFFSFLHDNKLQQFFDKINDFSLNSAGREEFVLGGIREFRRAAVFYTNLINRIEELRPYEAIVRLGSGKTWFDNSIGLAFNEEDAPREEKLLRDLILNTGIGKHAPRKLSKSTDFPTTRSFTEFKDHANEPFGWVKLTFTPRGN